MAVARPRAAAVRNYPPLVLAALVLLGLLAVLPSALNLPQTNPSQTLEYAPVPPGDEVQSSPQSGNFASLGLGTSASARSAAAAAEQTAGGATPGGGAVKTAGTKRCVGNPPRQTEDPMSPPCVASYTGNNGGATSQGVSADEVRVVFAFAGGTNHYGRSRNAHELDPVERYYDLAEPPEGDPGEEPLYVRALRVWQRYFNERYQTYGRLVHFYAHYGPEELSAESRRAQAAENYARLKPFAANAIDAAADAYGEVMAQKGVVVFNNLPFVPAATFSRYPGLFWNYPPSLELRAAIFTSHVCSKVVPHVVSDSGNPGENGRPRKYGLIYNQTETDTSYIRFRSLVRQRIEACGGEFVATGTYPCDCFANGNTAYAPPVMAEFRDKGVTTIIWAGGYEPNFSRAAKAVGYFPEWVIAGTGPAAATVNGQNQDQDVWDHAWVVTDLPLVDQTSTPAACAQAYAEADGYDHPIERGNTCAFYNTIRQMFTGIQVAGPRLNVANLDKGYHAIPRKDSPRPDLPACYYDVGDYTCVKDHTVMWWDSQGPGPAGAGCWRMPEGGRRYREGSWPSGNLDAQRRPDDVCNNHLGGGDFNTYAE